MEKDLKEIVGKSEKELRDLLKDKREELFKLGLDNKQNKLKNTGSIFNTRKEIARILTLIREKELASPATTASTSNVAQANAASRSLAETPADAKALTGRQKGIGV